MNKIEGYKKEKDGLDVLKDIPRYSQEGWETISDGDKERLKWLGVFLRRQTPGRFMMRLRIPNGMSNSAQLRAIAGIGREFGKGFVDITTRQQIQLRWFQIDHVQKIWDRLEKVGLVSLQTGMDSIRNVVGCPVAGITRNELFDASPVVRQFTGMFLGNKAYTNLPRKFNVTISGCFEGCVHATTQDIALTPAAKVLNGELVLGFNVAAGGKQGSGGYRAASPLDIFVPLEGAHNICSHITLTFRDNGSREARNKARLAFLIDEWGVDKFRAELERRAGHPLPAAGQDMVWDSKTDHIGIFTQKQVGLSYIGLVVPVGRLTTEQLLELARLADAYGNGEIRLTTSQNVIIPNIADEKLAALKAEPLLQDLRYDSSGVMRGLVSCTGIDYCHFALIETKELAMKTARYLDEKLESIKSPDNSLLKPGFSMHWSGCINSCGNHTTADIGLLGKQARVDGKTVDAVDVFVRKESGSSSGPAVKILESVPCSELPQVLARLTLQVPDRVPGDGMTGIESSSGKQGSDVAGSIASREFVALAHDDSD